MRVFCDTNVMLNLLGERIPYYNQPQKIITYTCEGLYHT